MVDQEMLLHQRGSNLYAGIEEKLGFWGGTISLAVTTIGTGILSFPYGFALCGYVAGPAEMVFIGFLAYLSYVSLIQCTAKLRVASYGALLQSLSRSWGHYTNLSLWSLLILATATYVLIAADIICSVALRGSAEKPFALQNSCLFAMILIVQFPLCALRSLHDLSAISAYCSCAITAVGAGIIFKACRTYAISPPVHELAATVKTSPRSVMLATPIFGCAMFGHMNVSQIYAELQPEFKLQATKVARTACIAIVLLYFTVGLTGYIAFGCRALPDIVVQIATHEGETGLVVLIQGLLASFIVLKTPLLVLPLRSLSVTIMDPTMHPGELPLHDHLLLTCFLLLCVYVVAIAMPALDLILEIAGAVCVIPLCFIVPARLSWAIEKPRPVARCIVMASFGIVASVLSLASVLLV